MKSRRRQRRSRCRLVIHTAECRQWVHIASEVRDSVPGHKKQVNRTDFNVKNRSNLSSKNTHFFPIPKPRGERTSALGISYHREERGTRAGKGGFERLRRRWRSHRRERRMSVIVNMPKSSRHVHGRLRTMMQGSFSNVKFWSQINVKITYILQTLKPRGERPNFLDGLCVERAVRMCGARCAGRVCDIKLVSKGQNTTQNRVEKERTFSRNKSPAASGKPSSQSGCCEMFVFNGSLYLLCSYVGVRTQGICLQSA